MPRFRRHGVIRPTAPCLLLLGVGALACYAGLLFDERALMAATICIAALIVVSLSLAVAQWAMAGKRSPRGRLSALLAPGQVKETAQYERIDQNGTVIDRLADEPPRKRGLYRRSSAALRWVSPFSLFVVRRIVPRSGETPVLPEPAERASASMKAADGRASGQSSLEQMGSVRDYAPGDALRLISWRHTARRGELMTRETGRDIRPMLLLVLNSDGACGLDDERMDRQVATLLPYLHDRRIGATHRLVVTDGRQFHEGGGRVSRFLAAVCANSDHACADSATACAASVAKYMSRQQGQVLALLCDASDSRGFATALRETPIADKLRILDPVAQASYTTAQVTPEIAQATPITAQATHTIAQATHTIAQAASQTAPSVPITARSVAAVALLAEFGVMLTALTALATPDGVWVWFAAALLGFAAIDVNIPWSTPRRGAARACAYGLVAALATAMLLVFRIHEVMSVWLFAPPEGTSAWQLVRAGVAEGFDQLNLQLPPLNVQGHGDLFLILLVAVVAIVLRCVLVSRTAMVGMALPPLVALAAGYALVGHAAPWWAVATLAVAFPMSLWAVRPRRIALPVPACASLVVMGIVLAGTPSAEALAYRVPLSLGEGGGLFSSNTVSPLIDLKRNIAAGSDSTVLSYRAYKRLYLRLTTLDDFDGDTWGFDKDLAIDGGLYGSGIQLGRDSADEISASQRRAAEPFTAYMRTLGYFGYDVATVNSDTLEQFMVDAKVNIATLRSRFLPVPGNATDLGGVGSSWLRYSDGSVYNRTDGTSSGMTYDVSATSITPISSSGGFSQIDLIDKVRADLLDDQSVTEERAAQWSQARRSLADSGLAQTQGDLVLIRATIAQDGTVSGPGGWTLGRVNTATERSSGRSLSEWGSSDDTYHMQSDGGFTGQDGVDAARRFDGITFNDTVVEQLGFGTDGCAFGVGDDGSEIGIVLPLEVSVNEDGRQGTLESDSGTVIADFSSMPSWIDDAVAVLTGTGLGRAIVSKAGGDRDASRSMRRMLARMVEESDERAHAARYTSLPKSLPSNIRAVVKQAQAAGIPIDGADYDSQMRVMRWLVEYFTNADNGFTYSLDAPDGDGRSNLTVINDFLDPETGHAGYCQHYASALAVLGRAMGVPTRIVLGYNAGTGERGSDGYYAVKSRQLHSWVEAYIDGVGWVPFDVTPASEDNDTLGDSAASSTDTQDSSTGDTSTDTSSSDSSANADTQSGDAQDGKSDDSKTESSDSAGADDSGSPASEVLSAWMAMPLWARIAAACGAGLLLVAALAFAPRGLRRWRRERCLVAARRAAARPDDTEALARAWRLAWVQVRREGRGRGLRRRAQETDMAFAERLAACYEDDAAAEAVRTIAGNAAAAAFGGTPRQARVLLDMLAALGHVPWPKA